MRAMMESGDAMSEVGTLKEMGVQVGDVVGHTHFADGIRRCSEWCYIHYIRDGYYGIAAYEDEETSRQHFKIDSDSKFRIISRTTPPLRTWAELTSAEKGALLLAHHETPGSVEFWSVYGWMPLNNLGWLDCVSYRHKPQPKIETVIQHWKTNKKSAFVPMSQYDKPHDPTHRITFQTIDGKPDCASVKMEEV